MAALQNNEDSDSDVEMGENGPQGECSFGSFEPFIEKQC